jgi:fibronectin type 3 domain-containing protein
MTVKTTIFFRTLAVSVLCAAGAASALAAAPSAPTGLVATAPLESQISLSWTASPEAASYTVYRGTVPHGEVRRQNSVTGTTFEDADLGNGRTYYYEVTAINGDGESGRSIEVSATTLPPPLTGFTATPGDSEVALKWNLSATATGCRIYRETLGGIGGAAQFSVTGTSFTDTGLINGTTYYYEITPVNASGENIGDISFNVIVTAQATPLAQSTMAAPAGPPADVTATAGNDRVLLNWPPVSNATSYQISRGTGSSAAMSLLTTVKAFAYTDATPTNGTAYRYIVKAVSAGGQTSSRPVTATPYVPAVPQHLAATAGIDRIVVHWTAADSSYAIYRGTASGAETLLDSGLTGNTFTDAGLVAGTRYFYKVQTLNAGGASALSEEISARPSGDSPRPWSGTIYFGLPGEPVQSCQASIPDLHRPVQAAFLTAEGPNMQAVATKYNAMILALDGFTPFNFGTTAQPLYLTTPSDTSHRVCILDYRWPPRSALRIQAALAAAAKMVPAHPEIAQTGLVLYGFSEGTDNVNMTVAQPPLLGRVLAVVNESEIDEDSSSPLVIMETVPHLFLASGLPDSCSSLDQHLSDLPTAAVNYDAFARGLATNQGAPLTVIDNVGAGHGGNLDHPFISLWLDSVLSQRLPPDLPVSAPVNLPSWQNRFSWVGRYDVASSTVPPWGTADHPGLRLIDCTVNLKTSSTDSRPFTWMPSQNIADQWLNYATTGHPPSFTP